MKDKQHDKSMVMSPTVKDEKQQLQQLRDREMREAHVEKQNCAMAKSKELKVFVFLVLTTGFQESSYCHFDLVVISAFRVGAAFK